MKQAVLTSARVTFLHRWPKYFTSFRLRVHTGWCGGIWKRSFISTVGLTVRTNRHQNRAFLENALQTGGIWKRRLCVFVWTENILKTELFENDVVTMIMWFPWASFVKRKSKWPLIVAFLNSSGIVWTENIWCVFRVQPPFANSSDLSFRVIFVLLSTPKRLVTLEFVQLNTGHP